MPFAVRTHQYAFLAVAFLSLRCQPSSPEDYPSETLDIEHVSEHVYRHVSYLETESFGRVPCNGMVVVNQGEAIIFDTPADDSTSQELIRWVENDLQATVKAVVPTHFHADCLGGLQAFHDRGIASYASDRTIALAKMNAKLVPETGFDEQLELSVGDEPVMIAFMGEGHTKDNVIGYYSDDRVMFGGCLVKEQGAGKGNLEDANVDEWSATVTRIKERFPNAEVVIPGHGIPGGTDLLDYTVALFKPAE